MCRDRIAVVGSTKDGQPTVLMIVDDMDEGQAIAAELSRGGTPATVVLLPPAVDENAGP